jgi:hypothetical protein
MVSPPVLVESLRGRYFGGGTFCSGLSDELVDEILSQAYRRKVLAAHVDLGENVFVAGVILYGSQ